MKITRHRKSEKFNPIKITITIMNEEELKALWGRLNVGSSVINRSNNEEFSTWCETNESLFDFWDTINDICVERELKLFS